FSRYLTGTDLFLLPRSRSELESVLRRYSYDSIHNAIAASRSTLARGGYSRVCHLAEKSITNVLNKGDNASTLVYLHQFPLKREVHEMYHCAPRPIASN
ncbi:hypothetical protein FIBSPDRAFT_865124, partial [Athelia psychrophila]